MDKFSFNLLINILKILIGLSWTIFCIYFRPKGFLKKLPKVYFLLSIFIGIGMMVVGLVRIQTILSIARP